MSRIKRAIQIILALLSTATTALAHEGKPHTYHDLWHSWTWEPMVCICLAVSAFLYWRGIRRFDIMSYRWEHWSFAAGWTALFVAFISPLHAWGQVLFSAHMTQHEMLMLVAAPLLVVGRPIAPFLLALPLPIAHALSHGARNTWFRAVWRVMTMPFVAWIIHAVALWVWHLPVLFQATLQSELIHTVQHLSFLFSALLFWWSVIHGRRGMMAYGAAVLYLFTTALHNGLLGALLTFASSYWYPAYQYTTLSWGLTPLQDQKLGGLIMWIPAGMVYIVAALALFAGWLRESDRVMRRPSHLHFGMILIAVFFLTSCSGNDRAAAEMTGGDPVRGKKALQQYGCVACHTIPGVRNADALVGPPLDHMASRTYIGGVVTNTPQNMVQWLKNPHQLDPRTAMPAVGLSDRDARDIAGYLYTLK